MIKARHMIIILSGRVPADMWHEAAGQEDPIAGRAKACARCPLRRGGEWEAGASAALKSMSPRWRGRLRRRWGCHESARPCAGMRRLVKAAEAGAL